MSKLEWAALVAFAVLPWILGGCEPVTMSNEDVIKEVRLCEEAGLKGSIYINIWTMRPHHVNCEYR